MKPIRIFTIVWGDKYLDWMNRGLCRSLSWPLNKEALKDARWTIYGEASQAQRIYEIATQVMPSHQIDRKDIVLFSPGQPYALKMMMDVMYRCIDERAVMLTAPPDTIFSEGSINAMMAYADQKDVCVSVPHPRVVDSVLDDLPAIAPENSKLVSLFIKHAHKAWTQSEGSIPVSSVSVGGVRWQLLEDKLYLVQHRIPTIYVSNFIDDDRRDFLRTYAGQPRQYGIWDHEWPADLVVGPEPRADKDPKKVIKSRQRQRMLGNSDLAFIMEVTNEWNNIPGQRLVNPDEPDAFHRPEYHAKINGQFESVWRAE